MKKILFILVAALLTTANASAQLFTGLSFDVKWSNEGSKSNSSDVVNSSYGGTISPQIGYIFNDKLMAGARINFDFDKSYYTLDDDKNKYLTASLGWDIAPFCRYKLKEFGENGWFSLWADIHAYFGMMYPNRIQEAGYVSRFYKYKTIYGIQAMPALGFKINEKSTLFVNVAIISLAYSGSTTTYDDRVDHANNLVLFTGKMSGLWTALTSEGMYGIKFGMVRKF